LSKPPIAASLPGVLCFAALKNALPTDATNTSRYRARDNFLRPGARCPPRQHARRQSHRTSVMVVLYVAPPIWTSDNVIALTLKA
jgi:hypothetical protein